MKVFLIGFMGAGKSTLATELGQRLRIPAYDLDDLMAKSSGRPVADMIRREGEDFFREMERDTLREFLDGEGGVLACGGGTPCFFDNMDTMLASGVVVYLDVPPKVLAERIAAQNAERPLLDGASGDALVHRVGEMLRYREQFYRRAHLTWDSGKWDVDALVRELKLHSR